MRSTTIHRFLLVSAAVATPGFVTFDPTGLTHEFGLINVQSISRIAIYLLLGFVFVATVANTERRSTLARENRYYGLTHGMELFLFIYMSYCITGLFVSSVTSIFLISYRASEWFLVILLCCYAFPFTNSARESHVALTSAFTNLAKAIVTIIAATVLLGSLFLPDIAHSYSIETGTFRLGGYLYHPNALGVLSGIGTILFWFCSKSRIEKLWAVVLLVIMLLTYSRGAVLGFIISVVYISIITKNIARIGGFAFVICAIVIFYYSFGSMYVDEQIISILQRGGDRSGLTTLSARTFVWEAALTSISASPLTGHGFIVGPKSLGELVGQPWWHAPHAHNDILNAAVGGGLVVATLTAAIYVRLAKATFGSHIPRELRTPIAA